MALADVSLQLINQARTGDRVATESLLRTIAPDLYRIAYSMLRDHDDTDEVVQETMIRMFRYVRNLKDPEKFPSWAMRVTVNQVQSWRMKRGRNRLVELPEGMEPERGAVIVGVHERDPRQQAIGGEIRAEIEAAGGGTAQPPADGACAVRDRGVLDQGSGGGDVVQRGGGEV